MCVGVMCVCVCVGVCLYVALAFHLKYQYLISTFASVGTREECVRLFSVCVCVSFLPYKGGSHCFCEMLQNQLILINFLLLLFFSFVFLSNCLSVKIQTRNDGTKYSE